MDTSSLPASLIATITMSNSAYRQEKFDEIAYSSSPRKHSDDAEIFSKVSDVQEKADSNPFEFWKSVDKDRTLDIYDGSLDPVYQAKARILNAAFQEIGMGRYQVCHRFITSSFRLLKKHIALVVPF